MIKLQNTTDDFSFKKYFSARNIIVAVSLLLALYIVGLVNPLTGPWFQYPYYKLACGREPILANDFMTKTYHTPDMKVYKGNIRTASGLYCTEEEAIKAGYQKSSAQ